MKKFLTNNSLETKDVGLQFAKNLMPGDTLLLFGNLGAGKTTFVQGIAKGLGIKDRILSPTFVLVRNHNVFVNNIKKLNHIDLYRIEEPTEIDKLGIEEFVGEEDSLTVIEWAERLLGFNPSKGYRIKFKYLENDKREITIEELWIK